MNLVEEFNDFKNNYAHTLQLRLYPESSIIEDIASLELFNRSMNYFLCNLQTFLGHTNISAHKDHIPIHGCHFLEISSWPLKSLIFSK